MDPKDMIDAAEAERLRQETEAALAAARKAIEDAGGGE